MVSTKCPSIDRKEQQYIIAVEVAEEIIEYTLAYRIRGLRPFQHHPVGNNIPHAYLPIEASRDVIAIMCWMELNRCDDVRMAEVL